MQDEFQRRVRQIRAQLARRARSAPGAAIRAKTPRAAVALVVRPGPGDLEVLLIKRATLQGDPWSGHMALPGGRRSPADRSDRETAIREAAEEVGIDLRDPAALLGQLNDVEPRSGAPQIVVSSFVFAVGAGAEARPNAEVALAVWAPLAKLAAPGAATQYLHALDGGARLRFPAIGYQEHVIWGITHRILAQFLEIAHTGAEQGGVP